MQQFKQIPLGRAKDLSKQKFGKLQPLYRIENKEGRTMWACQCDCGNIVASYADKISRGHTQSCGCYQKEQTSQANRSKIHPGDRFERLTVIQKADKIKSNPNDRYIYWVCQCDCGNYTVVSSNNLTKGHTRSCGCLHRDITSQLQGKDLTGQKFGLLTPIEIDKKRTNESRYRYWICQCDCGNLTSKSSAHLLDGRVISCGCLNMSRGEYKIKQLLEANNISFTQEQIFDDCINLNTNKHFRFDFYVNNQYLIEFNGEQHYLDKEEYFKSPLNTIKDRDEQKRKWAQRNNIPLIIIPYTQYDNLVIEDLLLETSKFIDKGE